MGVNLNHKHFHKQRKIQPLSKLDIAIYIVSFASPIMTIPQIYDIWFKGGAGVSLTTWITYLLAAIVWFIYGVKHRLKPIIYVNGAWIVLDVLIISGILLN